MKKNVVILGSTGSIGLNTIEILKKDKKNFNIVLLSTNSNLKKIFKQAYEFKVKNIIINNIEKYNEAKLKYKYKKIKIYNSFKDIDKIFNKKNIYYSMISVTGLVGLEPALLLSKYSKNLAIANKESIICGWNLINAKLKKYKTNFLPIDSEHYSIFTLLKNHDVNDIEKIYITASGGPFINFPKKNFKKIKPKNALKHPNWKMGQKITIDSATLMNKVFEVVEAKNIFNISYDQISILTHPDSYVHALVKLKTGTIKILIHEPDMKIPIFNSIYQSETKFIKTKPLNLSLMNNLNLKKVNILKFPTIKLLNKLPRYNSLFETILVTVNDYLVYKFLNKEINFDDLINLIIKIVNRKEFLKYKKIKPKNLEQIYKLKEYVSVKMKYLSV
jgi:1-deoxy-D-xylulose-5-phosphate reductoisomerase